MKQDEIILIADASGISFYGMGADRAKFIYYLKAFAKLVEDKEREACANIVEENANKCGVDTVAWMLLASNAEAIRARGQA